ncbi:MAG TPA: orotate phosphoribosyltransferase [Candidatus Bathyarchaeia archaeon]|nr:orotate phosphoribosyltransferase [Candidatus Bathyarchaeia archaeon]
MKKTHDELKALIATYALFSDGPYRLSAGELSDFYFDLRRVTLHPRGASLVAELMLARLGGVDAVGGMESGAIPIATAIALKSGKVRAFFVRKAQKEHGRMSRVEGCITKRDVVAFVEDVTTTGESVLSGIAAVEEFGCTVTQVMCILDRERGARERVESEGYRFEALFGASDFAK